MAKTLGRHGKWEGMTRKSFKRKTDRMPAPAHDQPIKTNDRRAKIEDGSSPSGEMFKKADKIIVTACIN